MASLLKKCSQWFLQPLISRKISKSSVYRYKDIVLHIPAGVFHPKYFFSTKYLLSQVLLLPLKNISFLELGAGNGLISIMAAKKGANVTATDISDQVIAALKQNAQENAVGMHIVKSDLFERIQEMHFDLIVINPPYYPKTPRNDLEKAWYCGANFEYFHQLFAQLKQQITANTMVLMVLSDGCDIAKITSIAAENKLAMHLYHSKSIWWETEFIFHIQ